MRVWTSIQFLKQIPLHFKHEGKDHLPMWRRVLEQYFLLLNNSITASNYYLLGLHRKYPGWAEKKKYVGHFLLEERYSKVNKPKYRELVADKIIFQLLAKKLGVPVLEILATYGDGGQERPWLTPKDEMALFETLRRPEMRDIFIKPSNLLQGRGTLALSGREETSAWESIPDGRSQGIDDVVKHIKRYPEASSWIIQRLAKPHAFTQAIVQQVVCTIRILVVNEGEPSIIGALFRFGAGNTAADNRPGQSYAAEINLLSGELGQAFAIENGLAVFYDHHPDTGVRISGKITPDWAEIKDLAIASSRKFSWLRLLGWDIALTDDGPRILEANSMAELLPVQVLRGRGLLDLPIGAALL